MKKHFHKFTPKKQVLFIRQLATHGNASQAAEEAKVLRETAYKLRERNLVFRKAWEDAIDVGLDQLEGEARRRACEGWEEPVFGSLGSTTGVGSQGVGVVGAIRKFSDTLLIFLLKGGRPEKYRDQWKGELTGSSGGPMQIELVNYKGASKNE